MKRAPFIQSDLFAILALYFFALGLRLIKLFDLDICLDEACMLLQIDKPFGAIWKLYQGDNFTPLYPWLIKIWSWVSRDVSWFRLFSALTGALTPPVAYLLGREVLDRRLGWLCGLAAAASVPLLFYSQLVRMYNVQPFFICLSLLCFLKALKTEQMKFWWLMAFANLLGFYVYYFTGFVVAAQALILMVHYRLEWRRYLKPALAQLPLVIAALPWIVPIVQRYGQIQGGFWSAPFSPSDYLKLFQYLGTGTDFRERHWLSILLNLPFLAGFALALLTLRKSREMRIVFAVFAIVVACFTGISLVGQSLFQRSYFTYVLPLYLILVFGGWLYLKKPCLKGVGIACAIFTLTFTAAYYYYDYLYMHDYYLFFRLRPYAEKGEGRYLSKMNAELAQRLQDDEAIIHYSAPPIHRINTYFASLFYHQRKLPEYIYSRRDLEHWNGRQFLNPGERISHLSDLQPAPVGVWVVSLDSTEHFFNSDVLKGVHPNLRLKWIYKENLPLELKDAGYELVDKVQMGIITALHFRRPVIPDTVQR